MSFTGDVQCAESTVPAFAKSWKYEGRGVNQCHTNQMYCHCSIKFEQICSDRLPFVFLCATCNKCSYPAQIYPRKRNTHQLSSPSKRKPARSCIRTDADFIKPVISSKTFSNWGRAIPVGHLFAAKKHNIHKCTHDIWLVSGLSLIEWVDLISQSHAHTSISQIKCDMLTCHTQLLL